MYFNVDILTTIHLHSVCSYADRDALVRTHGSIDKLLYVLLYLLVDPY